VRFAVDNGEEARLTPDGPTAAAIESRGPLPLRVRAEIGSGSGPRAHAGTAVVLGRETFEVVAAERRTGQTVYLLERWSPGQVIRDRVVYGPRFVTAAREARSRERVERWGGPLLGLARLALSVFSALLPARERKAFADRLSLDPVRGTVILLPLQVVGGFVLWIVGLIAFQQAHLESVAGAYTRQGTAPSQEEVLRAYGATSDVSPEALRPLIYALSPIAMALEYAFATGVLRTFQFIMHREPLADPILALFLAVPRLAAARKRARERRAALGPERPDRVEQAGEALAVLSAREKKDWRPGLHVEVDGQLFIVHAASETPDGLWRAFRYDLSPVEGSSFVRYRVRYEPPGRPPRMAAMPPPQADAVRPTRTVAPASSEPPTRRATAGSPALASRSVWRIDAGEEARLTPDGPTAACIESLGSLPLRSRSEAMGVHHRPEFPGACVVLGGQRFEVVEEQALETGFRYLLEPWSEEIVIRSAVEYGPRLVREAQRERQRALVRERAQRWAPLLYPLVGLLPEERQLIACDRFGLDATLATVAGAMLESSFAVAAALSLTGLFALLGAETLAAAFVVPAALRTLGALLVGEFAGSPYVGAAFAVAETLGQVGGRSDVTVLPLTRSAFWARLSQPDRHETHPDGSRVVRSVLPHLSWGSTGFARGLGHPPAIPVASDFWSVAPLPPAIDKGRLVYSYHIWPMRDPAMRKDLPDPPPPDPRYYQMEVGEEIAKEWDGLFRLAPWLPTLLPRDAQERAYRGRGGSEAARRWTMGTAALTAIAGLSLALGAGTLGLLAGLLLIGDAIHRAWRALNGDFAPSLLGFPISDYLRPERTSYQAHLRAEREALRALSGRRDATR
jgi:hypothetical protein